MDALLKHEELIKEIETHPNCVFESGLLRPMLVDLKREITKLKQLVPAKERQLYPALFNCSCRPWEKYQDTDCEYHARVFPHNFSNE